MESMCGTWPAGTSWYSTSEIGRHAFIDRAGNHTFEVKSGMQVNGMNAMTGATKIVAKAGLSIKNDRRLHAGMIHVGRRLAEPY